MLDIFYRRLNAVNILQRVSTSKHITQVLCFIFLPKVGHLKIFSLVHLRVKLQ